ncbi:MAG: NAD(P)H-hydrate dehydratase [Omnitrophica WOR_2 bacterium GWF2_43_52]|nr:MAG: NAD(P)H-hydrate dehydratase [Omnitrophica WOR_2 bacterium GWC2_44_8]OGX20956.1 MAG: NAD(P)H-hydrate dehydratase [Omnitrophica WOR_2 bacterium GWF2_43_52]HAH21135.1 NAD(P)H-hydrate dehydratase [Candidatus Omnitrophota bacterium]HBG63263.1 NAD(P)H-hydrate dehydratase [Candidatus Omnitrophota bacterium]HCD38032.1 NAD(P)H-hydrate dehydratase [Candidatus Omnitrophota bacterium]
MSSSSKRAVPSVFSHRKLDTHKGDYGHIFILAGSRGFTGAAILCANSAMRTGAGLVTLGIPESQYSIVAKRVSVEVMTKPLPETKEKTLSFAAYKKIFDFAKKADVLAMGPGLSRNPSTQRLVRKIISTIDKPMVIDADGLNALAGSLDISRRTNDERRRTTILTPHLAEFSRLIGKPVTYIQKNREKLAKKIASDYNIILVLKGHKTIVVSPDKKVYINTTGNPGMATAGSGDVLTGMIAALLGQGLNGFEAARIGVFLHGLAGDLAAKEKTQAGMIASDIIDKIPAAIKKSG